MVDAGTLDPIDVQGDGTSQLQGNVLLGPDTGQRTDGQKVQGVFDQSYLQPQLVTDERMRNVYAGAKTSEVATLVVRNAIYQDWETVWFQHTLGDPWAQFKFTATEDDTHLWDDWDGKMRYLLRFTVGDEVRLFLGGWQVMYGVILIRQVSYEKNSHGIVLQGVSLTYYAANASIVDEEAQYTGTFLDIASAVLAPTCSSYKVWGEIDGTPFRDPIHPEHGETIFQFLERIGRNRKVIVTSDPYGDFLFIGEHTGPWVYDLIEGENILKCQAIISDKEARSKFIASGHATGSDSINMGKAAQLRAEVDGTAHCYNPLLTPVEHPVWTQREVELRALDERMWAEGQGKVEATVTVQGWFNPITGQLWAPGQVVTFISPMTGIDYADDMKVKTVTFTQDKNGSLTTLVITKPWGINDNRFTRGGQPSAARSDLGPAQSPPTQTPHSQR